MFTEVIARNAELDNVDCLVNFRGISESYKKAFLIVYSWRRKLRLGRYRFDNVIDSSSVNNDPMNLQWETPKWCSRSRYPDWYFN